MTCVDERMFTSALERRGYVLRNVQDGAHELYHALTCGVPLSGGRSHREKLNASIEQHFHGMDRWWNEVEARTVERLVCARLGVEGQLLDFDRALRLSIEEADYFGVPSAPFSETRVYALKFLKTKRARAAVDVLLAYAARETP